MAHVQVDRRRMLVAGIAALSLASWPTPASATASGLSATAAAEGRGTIRLVARDDNGIQSPDESSTSGATPVSSFHGRFVVFSTAAALVPEDVNGTDDVYRRDMTRRVTTLVSVSARGVQGNDYSVEPSISRGGRYVAFTTWATNLFPGDDNGSALDVVVKDMRTGRLTLASRTTGGGQARQNSFSPVISANGRYVAFQSFGRFNRTDGDRREDVYVHDRVGRSTEHVSLSNRGRDLPARYLVGGISAGGRYVTFGDDNNAYVRDRRQHQTLRFWHEANDPESPFPAGTVGRPVISGNGKFVAFSTRSPDVVRGDVGHNSDVFRLNLTNGRFRLVSVAVDGGSADEESFLSSLSHNGRRVGFSSFASNLVAKDTLGSDTFVRAMGSGRTWITSAGPNGPGNADSGRNSAAISGDGKHMVYQSYASDLVRNDTNDLRDVFWWQAPGL